MNTKDIVYVALFAALMAALSVFPPITIPVLGVPVTAQSLGVMMAGGVLGAKRGALAMVLFLVLVAVGLPLLAGGRGGLGVFAGPTSGFLIGWVFAAWFIGFLTEKYWEKLNIGLAIGFCIAGGIVLLYAIGIPWVAYAAKIPLEEAFITSAVYLIGDSIKSLIAGAVMIAVKRSYPLIAR